VASQPSRADGCAVLRGVWSCATMAEPSRYSYQLGPVLLQAVAEEFLRMSGTVGVVWCSSTIRPRRRVHVACRRTTPDCGFPKMCLWLVTAMAFAPYLRVPLTSLTHHARSHSSRLEIVRARLTEETANHTDVSSSVLTYSRAPINPRYRVSIGPQDHE